MQVVLVMFRADGERRSFSVARDMTVIGRREDCDLRIPLGEVSRKHARLVKEAHTIRVEDLGSSNGTYLNGERVQEAVLNPGDTVQVGPVAFIVQIDGVPADEDVQVPVPVAHDEATLLAEPTMPSPVDYAGGIAPPPVPSDAFATAEIGADALEEVPQDEYAAEDEVSLEEVPADSIVTDEPEVVADDDIVELDEADVVEDDAVELEEVPAAGAEAPVEDAEEIVELSEVEEPVAPRPVRPAAPMMPAAPPLPAASEGLAVEEIPLDEVDLEAVDFSDSSLTTAPGAVTGTEADEVEMTAEAIADDEEPAAEGAGGAAHAFEFVDDADGEAAALPDDFTIEFDPEQSPDHAHRGHA